VIGLISFATGEGGTGEAREEGRGASGSASLTLPRCHRERSLANAEALTEIGLGVLPEEPEQRPEHVEHWYALTMVPFLSVRSLSCRRVRSHLTVSSTSSSEPTNMRGWRPPRTLERCSRLLTARTPPPCPARPGFPLRLRPLTAPLSRRYYRIRPGYPPWPRLLG